MTTKWAVLAAQLTIVDGENVIKFKEYNTGTPTATLTATVTPGTYYLYSDGSEADCLTKAIKDALEAAVGGTHTFDVSYRGQNDPASNTNGYVRIADEVDEFQLIDTGTTFPLSVIGYVENADLPAGASSVDLFSTLSPPYTWVSNQPVIEPLHDDLEGDAVQHRTVEGQAHTFVTSEPIKVWRMAFELIAEDRCKPAHDATDPARAFHQWWRLARRGVPFLFLQQDEFSTGLLNLMDSGDVVDTCVLGPDAVAKCPHMTMVDDSRLYDFVVPWQEHVA